MALAALIVAVAAATVSVLSFAWSIGWSIWQHRQLTRPALKLRLFFGFLPHRPTLPTLVLSPTNTGAVAVINVSPESCSGRIMPDP